MSSRGKQINRCQQCGEPLPSRFLLCESCLLEESRRNELNRKRGLDWLFSSLAEQHELKTKWIFYEIEDLTAGCTSETVLAITIVCAIIVLVLLAGTFL